VEIVTQLVIGWADGHKEIAHTFTATATVAGYEFTLQPTGNQAPFGGTVLVTFQTNFTPQKLELLTFTPETGVTVTPLEIPANNTLALSCLNQGGYYQLRAYCDENTYLDSQMFYVTGQTVALYGDVLADGTINAADALLTLQASVEQVTLTDQQKYTADVDGNQTLTAADALLILQKAVGKIENFPLAS
jgi:hypothetical protein